MTRLEDRLTLAADIVEPHAAGARLAPACMLSGIDLRTLQHWRAEDGGVRADRRPDAVRATLPQALSEDERARIVAVANEPRFADMPPARRPVLHGDNGASLKATTVLAMLHLLGIAPSLSCPRVSDDNAFAEALFRTAKYCPSFPSGGFADLAAAQCWAAAFARWYNFEHRHSGIRYVTPAQRHTGEDGALLAARHDLYQQARARHPQRWSGQTRDWSPIGAVTLNPKRDSVALTAQPTTPLSGSSGAPAFPSRPRSRRAAARSAGDGKRAATRSHAQRSEHGEDGEHCTFAAVSTVASSIQVEAAATTVLTTEAPSRTQ